MKNCHSKRTVERKKGEDLREGKRENRRKEGKEGGRGKAIRSVKRVFYPKFSIKKFFSLIFTCDWYHIHYSNEL